MGTLSALGRSGALARNTRNLMDTAISLRGLKNTEDQNARANAISMRKLGMEEESHALEMQTDKIELTKAENEATLAEEKRVKRARPISDIRKHPVVRGLPEGSQKAGFDYMVAQGYANAETGESTAGDMQDFIAEMNGNPEMFKTILADPLIKQADNAYEEKFKEVQDAKAATTPNPEKIKQLEAELNALWMTSEKVKGNMSEAAGKVKDASDAREKAKLKAETDERQAKITASQPKPMTEYGKYRVEENARKEVSALHKQEYSAAFRVAGLTGSSIQKFWEGDDGEIGMLIEKLTPKQQVALKDALAAADNKANDRRFAIDKERPYGPGEDTNAPPPGSSVTSYEDL